MVKTNGLGFGIVLLILSLVSIVPPCDARVAPGALDTTFGTDGKVTTDFFGYDDGANAVAIDSQGRIVAAGFANSCGGYYCFAVARYNANGSLDTTFGTDGKVTTDFFNEEGWAHALAIDSSDRIVLAGDTFGYFTLVRYNTDGSLDTTFGTDGKVADDFGGGENVPFALAIDSNGKIVVAGYTTSDNLYADFALARYNSDGSIDDTFGTDGKVTTDFKEYDYLYALAIDSTGKIVVAGSTQPEPYDAHLCDFALARYNTDGSLDTTFGTNGKVTTDFGGRDDECFTLAIDGQGRIVVAGFSADPDYTFSQFALARYKSDGNLDTTFSNDGIVITNFEGSYEAASALAIDKADKIVVAGYATSDFALARYNSNGSFDTTFGIDGKVTTKFEGSSGAASALAIDGSGKIVVAGLTTPDDGFYGDFALARYLAEEINPPTGTIQINGEADATRNTEVTLTLTATDDTPGKIRMCISNTMTCSTWTAFAETMSWTLTSGNGTKTVYVWFKDVWGNVNPTPYSDTILLDTKDPTDGTVTATPGNTQVALEWTGFADTGSEIGRYKVVFAAGTVPPSCSEGKVIYSGTDTSFIHDGLANGKKYGYRVCARDNAGNVSEGATVSTKPRPELNPPTGSITIKGGAEAAKCRNVTLTLTATDATPGAIKMCISNRATCTNWTAFAETKSWTLATGDGTKTVNVWFRDVWGNESDVPYSDTILLDTIAPTNGTVTATPGIGQVTLEWTGFTDTDSGIGDYKVVFSRGSAPASCSEGKQIYNGPDTTYLHTGLTPGTTYYYRVCAIDEAGNTSTGKTVKAKPQ